MAEGSTSLGKSREGRWMSSDDTDQKLDLVQVHAPLQLGAIPSNVPGTSMSLASPLIDGHSV